MFACVFNSWLGEAFYNTRFDTDDFVSKCMTVLLMPGVTAMASGICDREVDDLQTLKLSYAFLRIILVLKYVRAYYHLPSTRQLLAGLMFGFSAGICFMIVSAFPAHVGSTVSNACFGLGILADYSTPFLLLGQMIPVHSQHMPERFAGITALCCAGNLFAALPAGSNIGMATNWSATPIGCTVLSVTLPMVILLLYSGQIGVDVQNSKPCTKLRTYSYLYAHFPLTLFIQASSIAICKIDCLSDSCSDPQSSATSVRVLLCIAYAGIYIMLALLCLLSSPSNRRKAQIRLVFAVLTLALCSAGEWLSLNAHLLVVAGFGVTQLVIDHCPLSVIDQG